MFLDNGYFIFRFIIRYVIRICYFIGGIELFFLRGDFCLRLIKIELFIKIKVFLL